jgi:hypothetical protein
MEFLVSEKYNNLGFVKCPEIQTRCQDLLSFLSRSSNVGRPAHVVAFTLSSFRIYSDFGIGMGRTTTIQEDLDKRFSTPRTHSWSIRTSGPRSAPPAGDSK